MTLCGTVPSTGLALLVPCGGKRPTERQQRQRLAAKLLSVGRGWLRRGLLVALAFACAALAAVYLSRRGAPTPVGLRILAQSFEGPYTAAGPYVGPSETNIKPPEVILRDGVPLAYYPGSGYQQNPVTVAQYGLAAYSRFLRTDARSDRASALRASTWLVANQGRDGQWTYHFSFTFDGATVQSPWTSAMAQGQAMSLLERAYRLTGRRSYLTTALRALQPLQRRPLRQCFRGDCRLPFFEEYPSRPETDVLNGFMFTLLGLYDLNSVAPHSAAVRLYRAGRRTLDAVLPRYDDHGLARYDLASPAPASSSYQAVHVYLLRALNSLTPDREVRDYAVRWRRHLAAT